MTKKMSPPIKRRFFIVLGCLTGMGALSIDMSLASIPYMVHDLSSNLSTGQLTIGFFMAGVALGQLPSGLISDRIGRIPFLLSGLAIFIVAGIFTAMATSMKILLLARFVQGLGASVGISVSRAMVRDIASGKEAANILSLMVMIFTFIPMLAPILGSYLVSSFNWRAPFFAITIFGGIILVGINKCLHETRIPNKENLVQKQFLIGIKEFFSHKESIFGMLLIVVSTMGYMSLISGSSALIIRIYKFPVEWFGVIFSLTGLTVLIGSLLNRQLLKKFKIIQISGFGATLVGIGGLLLMYIAWLNQTSFIFLWFSVCLYMLGTSFLIANATAIALDPVPKIAGIAASIIGTLQNLGSSIGSITTSLIYNGSIRNTILVMSIFGVVTSIIFLIGFRWINDDPPATNN